MVEGPRTTCRPHLANGMRAASQHQTPIRFHSSAESFPLCNLKISDKKLVKWKTTSINKINQRMSAPPFTDEIRDGIFNSPERRDLKFRFSSVAE